MLLGPRCPTPGAAAAALALAAAALAGCGSDEATGPCGPVTREALDSAFLLHVLPGDSPPAGDYRSDPPTSGPHTPGPDLPDLPEAPLSRAVQVGALERGDVLIQHDPDLPADQVAALAGLAGDGVVVAPNPELPAPVVATAWVHKQTCAEVGDASIEVLAEFAETRLGQGPGDDG